jgi:hypothetical protein
VNKAKESQSDSFANVAIEIATLLLANLALSPLVESLVKPWVEVQVGWRDNQQVELQSVHAQSSDIQGNAHPERKLKDNW